VTTALQRVHKPFDCFQSPGSQCGSPYQWRTLWHWNRFLSVLRFSPVSVIPPRLHTTRAPSLTSSAVGRQKSHVAPTHRLVWAMLTAMGLGRTLLARSAKGRKVNGQIKKRRGWYSESWGQLCLSLSSLSLLVTPAARPVRRHWTTCTAASPSTDWASV